MKEWCHNTYIDSFPWKFWTSMLRKRNRRREGWGKSKRVTGQREHWHAWRGKWEKTKIGGTGGGGLHITHRVEEKEIKRRERGKKEETDTQDFPGTRRGKSQGPEWQGEGRGLNRDQFIFAQLCIAEWICYGWMSLFSGYMCCQKHWKPAENVCVWERQRCQFCVGWYLML